MLLLVLLTLAPTTLRAEEVFPLLKLGDVTLTNARPAEVNATDLLFKGDGPVFRRVKRQDLPAELKDKYPYDPVKAEEYEKQKAEKAKAQQEQRRRETKTALERQEQDIQANIARKEAEVISIQKEIRAWRSKPKGMPGRGKALDQLIDRREHTSRYVETLKQQLEGVRRQLELYR